MYDVLKAEFSQHSVHLAQKSDGEHYPLIHFHIVYVQIGELSGLSFTIRIITVTDK